MCFKKCAQDSILKGSLLAMLENLFPDEIPTLKDYARETEISVSTFNLLSAGRRWDFFWISVTP